MAVCFYFMFEAFISFSAPRKISQIVHVQLWKTLHGGKKPQQQVEMYTCMFRVLEFALKCKTSNNDAYALLQQF